MKENGKDAINDNKIENGIKKEEIKEIQKESDKPQKENNDNNNKKEINTNNSNNINNDINEIRNEIKNGLENAKEDENKIIPVKEIKNIETKKIHSSVITTGKEKINDIYLKKVKDLSNIYSYTTNYILFLTQLFKKTSEPFYSNLSSSYINNIKPYLKYFKDLVTILSSFSEKINTLNSSINPELYEKDEESIIRTENNLNLSVKKINSSLCDVYNNISKDLKEIINKPLFQKLETVELILEENFHKMLTLISNLEQIRIKYNTEFSKRYVNSFNTFIDKYNEMGNYLLNMKDFFSIEYDIVSAANYVINKANNFITSIKKLYDESINIFCDYLEILKTMIRIYYKENKKIILPKILPEKMLNDLEKLLNQNIRKNIEKKFGIKNIIEHYHDEKLRNEINHLLLQFHDILSKYKIINNENINDLSKFDLQYFKSTEIFFEFIKGLIPPEYQLNYEDGIQFKTGVKRFCGLFKGWKECQLVISYQGHILFFDEDNNNKNIINNKEDIESSQRAHTVIIDKVNVNIGLDELNNSPININYKNKDEAKYGIIPQNLSLKYFKSNYGIRKKNQKQGKFLFEIWEKNLGNKKNKVNVIDALYAKNLENILLELTETNIYDD
jgi:hypothetical protein